MPADQLLLDIFTEKASDSVVRLDREKITLPSQNGGKVSQLQELLQARSGDPLPETVQRFLSDIADRADRLKDRGPGSAD